MIMRKLNFFVFFDEACLACRADYIGGVYCIVEVNLTAAVRAHCAVELCFVVAAIAAAAIVIFVIAAVAVAAITVIVVAITVAIAVVEFFPNLSFEVAKVTVKLFEVVVCSFYIFLELFDLVSHLVAKFYESVDDLALSCSCVKVSTFDEALDVSACFFSCHSNISFLFTN